MSYSDNTPMPFGKYKGEKLINVPASYLLWWLDNCRRDDWRDLQAYIKENKEVLEKESKQNFKS